MNVRTKRTAFTLLETLVSLGAATVLLIGLASSVRIVGRTLRNVAVDTRNSPVGPYERLRDDLRHATSMSQATSTTLSFTVPDRNGDGQRETLSYRINNNQLERSEAVVPTMEQG